MLINLFQRHHLVLFILLSGLSGLSLGNLVATTIAMRVTPDIATEKLQPAVPGPVKSRTSLASYQPILKRNIFNSAADSQELRAVKVQPRKTTPVKTRTTWTLIGTISGGPSPLAILSSKGKAIPYSLKTRLPDDAILSAISRNQVELRYPDGQIQVLEALPNKKQTITRQKKRQTRNSPDQQKIENLGQNRWLIPIQVAENARTNMGGLLRQAQAVPYLEGGQTTGFQIRMIQPGSLIAQLGLKKGDILREINGLPLNSPEKALQIFGQIRQAKQVSIGLERRGKAMTFAYEIK